MKRCPRCFDQLHPEEVEEIMVFRCTHCFGLFVPSEKCTALLGPLVDVNLWIGSKWAQFLGYSNLKSPKTGQRMQHVQVDWKEHSVTLDLCEQTAGIWFDAGEMKAIKDITIEIAQEQGGTFSSIQTEMGIKTYLFQLIFRLPVELCNPVRRTPIVTYLLIGLCCLMFIYQLSATDMEAQTRALALLPNVLQGEQVWGLVTYIFMHGGIMHLFGNMYMLYVFGDNVEDVVGRSRYLVLFLLCGVAGALMQVIMQSGDIMVVGASGAIAGLMGMYWILFPRVKVRLMILVFPLFVQVQYFFVFWILSNVLGLFGDEGGVALYCHIGGFLFGLLAALPFRNLDIQESSASSS